MLLTNSEDIHKKTKEQYESMRENYTNRQSYKTISIEQARKNHYPIDWDKAIISTPSFLGVKEFSNITLESLMKYIDWTPFFSAWRLRGPYPKILEDEKYGEEAKKLFADAQFYIKELINSGQQLNKAKVGFFPANSVQDDIELYAGKLTSKTVDIDKTQVIETLSMLRSQREMKEENSYNRSLSDYIAPKESLKQDYIGAFVITTGLGLEKILKKYEDDQDDYAIIMLKTISDRFAEAFAEYMHEWVRKELWGHAPSENFSNNDLIREKYKGIRPAPGYASCPDHTEKKKLFKLLNAEEIGVNLTESYAMYPASSVSGWYFSHPEAKYFNIGKIEKDQVLDYAKRKEYTLEQTEKWLRSILNYD